MNIDCLYGPADARHWVNYLADWTTDTPNNPAVNIDEHGVTIKKTLFSRAVWVVNYVPQGRHKIWVTADA